MPVTRHGRQPRSNGGGATKARSAQAFRGSTIAELEARTLAALKAPGRTDGVRKIAARFGVNAATVQRISRPSDTTE